VIKVLVVDDYQEHIDTLVNTLNMYGCEARGCSSGAEGLRISQEWQPHLVICDGLLGKMRAWQFAHTLLSQGDAAQRPYLVALTGFGSKLQRVLCEECGYDEYVNKPIELSTLLGWVQKARTRFEQNFAI
jgi:CheY-like chemotaxis protein